MLRGGPNWPGLYESQNERSGDKSVCAVADNLCEKDVPSMKYVPIYEALAQPRQKKPRHGGTVIYALVDPLDSCVRYVGKTRSDLRRRLEFHLNQPTNRWTARWFSDLRANKQRPEIVALEYVDDHEWEDAERGWIHWFRERGQLLNIDPGGEYRHSDGRLRGVKLGKFQPPSSVVIPTQADGRKPRRHVRGKRDMWSRLRLPMPGNS